MHTRALIQCKNKKKLWKRLCHMSCLCCTIDLENEIESLRRWHVGTLLYPTRHAVSWKVITGNWSHKKGSTVPWKKCQTEIEHVTSSNEDLVKHTFYKLNFEAACRISSHVVHMFKKILRVWHIVSYTFFLESATKKFRTCDIKKNQSGTWNPLLVAEAHYSRAHGNNGSFRNSTSKAFLTSNI